MTETMTLPLADTLAALQTLELFEGINEQTLMQVAAESEIVEFADRDWIFRENDLAKHVYFLLSGRVALVICRPNAGCRELMALGAGELLGWSPLVQRPRFSAAAVVRERTRAIRIDADKLTKLNEQDPKFFCNFMSRVANIVAQRLTATRQQVLEMCGIRLPEIAIESD